jgi:hypothetical protein
MTKPDPTALLEDAEALVQAAEEALAGARGGTWQDIRETELRAALQLQDDVCATVGPAVERRRVAELERLRAVFRSPDDPKFNWMAKHRRWMDAATTSSSFRD